MRRFVYCKVVLTTSLVWVLLDVFLLLYFSECNKCDDRKDRSLLPALRGEPVRRLLALAPIVRALAPPAARARLSADLAAAPAGPDPNRTRPREARRPSSIIRRPRRRACWPSPQSYAPSRRPPPELDYPQTSPPRLLAQPQSYAPSRRPSSITRRPRRRACWPRPQSYAPSRRPSSITRRPRRRACWPRPEPYAPSRRPPPELDYPQTSPPRLLAQTRTVRALARPAARARLPADLAAAPAGPAPIIRALAPPAARARLPADLAAAPAGPAPIIRALAPPELDYPQTSPPRLLAQPQSYAPSRRPSSITRRPRRRACWPSPNHTRPRAARARLPADLAAAPAGPGPNRTRPRAARRLSSIIRRPRRHARSQRFTGRGNAPLKRRIRRASERREGHDLPRLSGGALAFRGQRAAEEPS